METNIHIATAKNNGEARESRSQVIKLKQNLNRGI